MTFSYAPNIDNKCCTTMLERLAVALECAAEPLVHYNHYQKWQERYFDLVEVLQVWLID